MAPAAHPVAVRAVRLYLLLSGLHLVLGGSLLPEAGGGLRPPQEKSEAVSWDQNAGSVAINVTRAVVAQFTPANTSHRLTHLALDPDTDDVYLGAVNRLYQLDGGSFLPVHQVVTGPRLDSPECHAASCDDHIYQVPTDNYNKLLVVAPSVSAVIACGSVSQGACDTYRLGNLSVHEDYIPRSVAANHPDASTFAFVGPERYSPWGRSSALYVGTTFTTVGDYRHDVPAISTRNLYDLDYAEYSFSKQSLLRIDVKVRDHFLVQYVYGFTDNNYVYFVTVQKKSHLPGQEELGYISRISRSCITDANYDSYTEITLECVGGDGVNYNLVQDAKLVVAGSDLAASVGVAEGGHVLVAAFAPSEGHTARPETASAVCVYSVHDIEAKFNENIHMCFNGSMQYRSMEYISGTILNGKCPQQGAMGNILSFCEVGLKISGPAPMVGRAALRLPRVLVTGVQGTATAAHTVAFLGTSVGTLKKILVATAEEAAEYEEVGVDRGFPLLPDMRFDKHRRFLYVISSSKASKVKVESCSSYTNCSSCLTARDPYCGWCSLEKRCTVQSACQKATFSSPRWLSFGSGQQCIDFEMILPDRLPITQSATVRLTIRTLPELPAGAKYQCVWGSAPPEDGLVTPLGLTCGTPAPQHRPPIPAHHDHVLVPLAVRSSETNKDFVSRNFAFYDCGRHNTCGSCVRSNWACNWCVYENTCTHNASSCSGRTIISGEKNPAQLDQHGARFCPRFWPEQKQLLAADGATSELVLLVENLPVPRASQLGFQCVVSVEGATMKVGARVIVNDEDLEDDGGGGDPTTATSTRPQYHRRLQRVVCEPTVYRYESAEGEYEARVTLVWNHDHVVDARPLTLYKCGVLGAHRGHHDCSLCVTRHPRYRCAWCGAACRYAPHCPVAAASSSPSLPRPPLEDARLSQCPTPRIDLIQPLAGPLEGGTLVTIEGSNLGLREEDVQGNIFIGEVLCKVHEYHVSVKITCRTGPAPALTSASQDMQFPVRVTTPAGTTRSTVKFTYTNVSVTGVWPTRGPVSGGTVLSISGRFLNVGSHVSAELDHLPCIVNKTQSSSHRLVCVTSRASGLTESGKEGEGLPATVKTLTVTVDGARRTLASPFIYTPDPKILELKPRHTPWSGGRLLTVHGTQLDAIQSPRITVLLHDHVLNSSMCRVLSHDQMECPSPCVNRAVLLAMLRERRGAPEAVPEPRAAARTSHKVSRSPRQNFGNSITLDVGFIMDNVASVRNLRHVLSSGARSLVYVLDPEYRSFPNGIKLYKGDTLVIEGENLNLASDDSDVNVTIGTKQCNVTSLALTQLVCTPPELQPPPTDELGRSTVLDLPLVVVRMGQNLRFPIGYLRYEMIKEYQFPPEAIGGMAAGGLFLVLVSMVVLVVYRRKSNQAEREYKRIQIQMDTLESNVRSECKQAFAELQTDMTDLTADLEASGIPTLDHRTYVMKVFFPGVVDHPILNDPKMRTNGCRPAMESATVQFEQLIANRYFLLALIETLEAQKTFNIRDKVNVASLLVVAMAGKMEYLTEVLRLLMLRLMEKSVATKHPQLMLRRTESVVEKMLTNWMALCMYNYLKEHAGPSLFLLFKAIKHQVEKGPVDAVTHDARYSLSEERLLREQITHSYVSVAVVGEDGEKAQCRVLDCDTITQVKAKILDALYRNTPHSLRPSVHQVDLEWRHGRNGHLVLADEDMTTKSDSGGWRRLNTLAHYGVRDSALMALVHRPHAHLNNANCGTGTSKCATCSTFGVSGSGSPVSHCGGGDVECGSSDANVYHLVKPVDHDSPNRGGERTHKAIPEIFLTRLLSTKGTVQKFVDDFFKTILNANESLPPAVKWLFDLFDESSRRHGLIDPEVVLAWKSNSLPLRFWVNFIKNPDFILDVHKSPTVDSCLSVIAQTFMDACSTTEHRLGKDSPSNKLLFAKDITQYKASVRAFYHGVRTLPPVTDQDMAAYLHHLSLTHLSELDSKPAVQELFHTYITRYYSQIMETLEMDPNCRTLHLAHKLDNVMCTINGEPTSMC
ncbi:plexin-B-like isoform X2 [Portunus trituberculatus]|uniref:plexin-B-like isoform X2 n=1 Tax=Portunus trituberculatus TaxID=210409 RepID=UPI001E1CBB7C|nr:plexin-B-like isoform X2 [Portunus trituberculatus]